MGVRFLEVDGVIDDGCDKRYGKKRRVGYGKCYSDV